MSAASRHLERHRSRNVGWLRAAVLGANDGILSTASLVLGVAAAHGTRQAVLNAANWPASTSAGGSIWILPPRSRTS